MSAKTIRPRRQCVNGESAYTAIYGILPAPVTYPQAKAAARRAIELDDSLGEAYATFGLSIEISECDWEETERIYRKALELNPNYPLAHEWYSSLLIGSGRFDEGIAEIKRAEELDPLSLRERTLTAWSYYQVRQYQESTARARQIIDLDRNNFQGYFQLGNALLEMGQAEKGLAAIRESLRLMPGAMLPTCMLCFALVAAGRREEAEQVRGELMATAGRAYVKEYFLGMAHLALGDHAFR